MKERVVGRRGGRGARFCLYEALTGDSEYREFPSSTSINF